MTAGHGHYTTEMMIISTTFLSGSYYDVVLSHYTDTTKTWESGSPASQQIATLLIDYSNVNSKWYWTSQLLTIGYPSQARETCGVDRSCSRVLCIESHWNADRLWSCLYHTRAPLFWDFVRLCRFWIFGNTYCAIFLPREPISFIVRPHMLTNAHYCTKTCNVAKKLSRPLIPGKHFLFKPVKKMDKRWGLGWT